MEFMGTEWKSHEAGIQNSQFHKYCRQIIESQMTRRSARARNELNRPLIKTSVRRLDSCTRTIFNVIISYEQTS